MVLSYACNGPTDFLLLSTTLLANGYTNANFIKLHACFGF